LLGALAVVLVLGIFFTVHKLHQSGAAENKSAAGGVPAPQPNVVTPAPAPAVAKVEAPKVSAPTTKPAAAKDPNSFAADEGLVTQTPTSVAKAPSNSSTSNSVAPSSVAPGAGGADFGPPATQLGTLALSGSAQARSGLPDLSRVPAPEIASPVAETTRDVKTNTPAPVIPDAKARADGGDLLATRQLLNDGLITGKLADADADAARRQIDEINKTVVFSAKKFPEDPWGGVYQVASGERLATIAARNGVTWEFLSRVNGVTPKKLRSGQNIKVFKGPFYAVVYKHLFKMEIYLGAPAGPGSMYVTSFPVGLGKDNSTPTGVWMCKTGDKIRNPRYYPPRGGEIMAPDDPKNPLGGYWIAIEGLDGQAVGKESYGIHGTIDPTSIGKMESMGCIRLKAEDISWVFDLLVDGKSRVLVKE
jgi:LysM repeat protein